MLLTSKVIQSTMTTCSGVGSRCLPDVERNFQRVPLGRPGGPVPADAVGHFFITGRGRGGHTVRIFPIPVRSFRQRNFFPLRAPPRISVIPSVGDFRCHACFPFITSPDCCLGGQKNHPRKILLWSIPRDSPLRVSSSRTAPQFFAWHVRKRRVVHAPAIPCMWITRVRGRAFLQIGNPGPKPSQPEMPDIPRRG